MPKTVVALEATINSSGAEGSVKSLKAQLKEAQAEVQNLSDKFGETSVQAADAAKKAAQLKDRIGDAKALTDAFNPDKKFQAFSSALSGVAGGFSAVQGAMGLLGSNSKDLEKTMLKVQSAMALSQGLSAITEAQDSFKNLKTVAVDAFKGIKAAIGSTGIGLLVIALGAIYAYWDDIKGAVNGVSAEQEKLNAKTKANLDVEKEKLKNIGSQDNILKLQGKSEKDILGIKIKQIDAVIKATEASIVQSEITKNAQVKAAQRNKEILTGLLNFLSVPITTILFAVDKIRNVLGGTSTLLKDYKEGLAKMVFNPEETKKEGDKEIQAQKDALLALKNDRAGFQLQIQAIDKGASDKSKAEKEKDDKEAAQKNKERLDNIAAQNKATEDLILRNTRASIKDAFDKKQFDLAVQKQTEIDDQLDLLNKGLITEEEYKQRKALIDANYKQQEKDLLDAHHIEIDQKTKDANEKKAADDKKEKDEALARAQALAKAEQELEDAKWNALSAGIGIAKSLGEKNKGIQKIALIAENAVTVAKIILDTQKAIAGARLTASLVPPLLPPGIPNPAYPVAKGIAAANILSAKINGAVGIATAIAATAKGLSALGGGGGGGGGSVGGGGADGGGTTAPVQPQVQSTTLNQGQVNQLASATSRAFVLESDVSGNQERIQRLNRAARIN
jgi:hypothetical protein